MPKLTTILFDLDGTLLDTAQDIALALNTLLREEGRQALPFAVIRPAVSHGTSALLNLAFSIDKLDPAFKNLRERLLNLYANTIVKHTRPFPGIIDLLKTLDNENIRWGIVTNKPANLTDAILKKLTVLNKSACVVSGDTLNKCKPDPEPVLHACKLLNCQPIQTLFIGDALNDVLAGTRAGTHTLIAKYGYISDHDEPEQWGAHGSINHPNEIIPWVASYFN